MALFGLARGLLRLDLGTVASWSELRAEFQKSPVRCVCGGGGGKEGC